MATATLQSAPATGRHQWRVLRETTDRPIIPTERRGVKALSDHELGERRDVLRLEVSLLEDAEEFLAGGPLAEPLGRAVTAHRHELYDVIMELGRRREGAA